MAKGGEVRPLTDDVACLRAVAGMIPPGATDFKRELNTVHTLVALRGSGRWEAARFQATPAAWHGRPKDAEALLDELREVARSGVTTA